MGIPSVQKSILYQQESSVVFLKFFAPKTLNILYRSMSTLQGYMLQSFIIMSIKAPQEILSNSNLMFLMALTFLLKKKINGGLKIKEVVTRKLRSNSAQTIHFWASKAKSILNIEGMDSSVECIMNLVRVIIPSSVRVILPS